MDFKKFLADSKIAGLRMGLTTLSPIILIPVITRFIGEAEYGIWVTILAVISVFGSIGGSHMHGALIRYSSSENSYGQTFSDTFSIIIFTSLITVIIFTLLSLFIGVIPYRGISNSKIIVVISVAVLIYSKIITQYLENYPRSRNNVIQYEIIKIIQLLFYVSVLPISFYISRSILVGLWMLIVMYFIISISLLVYYYPHWMNIPKVDNFSQYLSYSIPMLPKSVSTSVFSNADKYLIFYFLSPSSVAVYAVSYTIVSVFRNISGFLNSALYPSVTEAWENNEEDEIVALYYNIFRFYLIVGIPSLAGLTLLGSPILKILSTSEIARRGVILIPLLGVGFLIWGLENPLAYILTASEDTDKIALITIFSSFLNIILNIILIPIFGLIGAVVATVNSQVIKTGYMFYWAHTRISISFPYRTLVKCIFSTILMTVTIMNIDFSLNNVHSVIVYTIFGALVYFSILYIIGGIKINELNYVLR